MEREPKSVPKDFSITGEPGRRRIVAPSPEPAAVTKTDAPPEVPQPASAGSDDSRLSLSFPLASAPPSPSPSPLLTTGRLSRSRETPPQPLGAPPVQADPPPTQALVPHVPATPVPAPDTEAALSLVKAMKERMSELERKVDRQQLEIEILHRQVEDGRTTKKAEPVDIEFHECDIDLHPPKPESLKFELDDLLRVVIKHQASDLHLKVNSAPIVRLHGDLVPIGEKPLTVEECHYLVLQAIPERKRPNFLHIREVDHAHVAQGVRFRLNAFMERGRLSAAFRMVRAHIPNFEQLGLPSVMTRFASLHNGLVLVTGPAGCGKSTTLASLVDWINKNRKVHVVTVEDPIEYYHHDQGSFITQREIGTDTSSFVEALRQALRQDPNVILVGEMRDVETMMTAVTAAETGHLVLSTLHTPNTVQAIDRILDAFSGDQQKQIRMLLSSSLRGVVSQKLLTRADGQGRVPAVEVLVCTSTVSSFILEGNTKEIYPFIQQGAHEGMQTFTDSLRRLLERGQVTREEAMFHAEQLTELRLATRHVTGAPAPPGTIMNRL